MIKALRTAVFFSDFFRPCDFWTLISSWEEHDPFACKGNMFVFDPTFYFLCWLLYEQYACWVTSPATLAQFTYLFEFANKCEMPESLFLFKMNFFCFERTYYIMPVNSGTRERDDIFEYIWITMLIVFQSCLVSSALLLLRKQQNFSDYTTGPGQWRRHLWWWSFWGGWSCNIIWGFPEMVVPNNHGFSY